MIHRRINLFLWWHVCSNSHLEMNRYLGDIVLRLKMRPGSRCEKGEHRVKHGTTRGGAPERSAQRHDVKTC